MKSICIYYSRTQNSAKIAKEIAEKTSSELIEISDGKNYSGFFGYIRAAVKGLSKKLPALLPYDCKGKIGEYDRVIIVSPVWCENICPIVRAFLEENKGDLRGDVYFVLTHMASLSYEDAINAEFALIGKTAQATLSLQTRKHEWTSELSDFIESMNRDITEE